LHYILIFFSVIYYIALEQSAAFGVISQPARLTLSAVIVSLLAQLSRQKHLHVRFLASGI